jgi:chorismate mutase
MSDQFYLVKREVVPDIYAKIIEVKKLLRSAADYSINEAVKAVGISRSAYYKYKDCIFLESEIGKKSITTIGLLLKHVPGVLSKLLNVIAEKEGNVLTINQNIPIHNIANVTITFEGDSYDVNMDELIDTIRKTEGVVSVTVIGKQ